MKYTTPASVSYRPAAVVHLPTGKQCSLMAGPNGGRFFCNFGLATNPFTWVEGDELRAICRRCGSEHKLDRSCGCFDNEAQ